MAWDVILGGSGLVALAGAALAHFIKSAIDSGFKEAQSRIDSELKRAEAQRRASLASAGPLDVDLRARRAAAYQELWRRTGALPRRPREGEGEGEREGERDRELTCDDVRRLLDDLSAWYFEGGGMWLSSEARRAYDALQEAIAAALERAGPGRVASGDHEAIRSASSRLRAELSRDLLSRRAQPDP
ncbi:MAG TPA: hypothetical protein VKZ63_21210 [Kofleriaceae bacterium]|nr:hypothetical protein [Kofleriaceae bacterium]